MMRPIGAQNGTGLLHWKATGKRPKAGDEPQSLSTRLSHGRLKRSRSRRGPARSNQETERGEDQRVSYERRVLANQRGAGNGDHRLRQVNLAFGKQAEQATAGSALSIGVQRLMEAAIGAENLDQ